MNDSARGDPGVSQEWRDSAEANVERWGNQTPAVLLLAMVEELGEIAMEMEAHSGPGGGSPPIGDYDNCPHRGRELISMTARLGREVREYLETEFPEPAGDGTHERPPRITGDVETAPIREELDDLAPLCWQLAWALERDK